MLKSIFLNPEFKAFFRGFLILYMVFSAVLIAILYFAGLQLEREMIWREVALIGNLLHDHPEEEDRVISALFQERSDVDFAEGSKVVSRYGLEVNQVSFRHSRQWFFYRQLGIVIAFLLVGGLMLFVGMAAGQIARHSYGW